MSFGFFKPSTPPASSNYQMLQSIVNTNLYIRHCDFVLWQSLWQPLSEDFYWVCMLCPVIIFVCVA